MLTKVLGLQEKYDSLQAQLSDPDVISDMKKYVQLNKQYKELAPVIKAGQEYKMMIEELEMAKDIIANEKDEDLREMAKDQIAEIEPKLPQMEQDIKLLLIPADPEDEKNAILEIRGGAGGDEAAIFAGDLFRMYSKYVESKGWKMEVTSQPVRRRCRRLQGDCLQGKRRPRVRYPEIRVRSAPRAACAPDRDPGPRPDLCSFGSRASGGR